jgi:hypothetical protein
VQEQTSAQRRDLPILKVLIALESAGFIVLADFLGNQGAIYCDYDFLMQTLNASDPQGSWHCSVLPRELLYC